jgi:O-antigen ligase
METKISSPYSNIGKYLLYALLVFSPLSRGSVHYWQHTVIVIFALSILFVLLLEKGFTGKPSFRKYALDKPIVAILILAIISSLLGLSVADSGDALVLLLSYVSVFYTTLYCIRTREDQRQLVYVICSIGLLLSLIGILKMFGLTLSFWVYEELNYPAWFVSGVYGNHNHLAGYLEMVIPLCLSLFFMRTRGGLAFLAIFGTAVVLISSHILTMSRGGWLTLGASLTVFNGSIIFP